MGVYGTSETAASTNVNFNFELALQSARDLYQLSGKVETCASQRAAAANIARPEWQGEKRSQFDTKIGVEGQDASTVSSELVALANKFAESWSQARGQQDRINQARYTQYQENHESWGDKEIRNPLFGDQNWGGPPPNPPVPGPPGYAPTRAPIHPEFENRH